MITNVAPRPLLIESSLDCGSSRCARQDLLNSVAVASLLMAETLGERILSLETSIHDI